jgi:hypothetical protein
MTSDLDDITDLIADLRYRERILDQLSRDPVNNPCARSELRNIQRRLGELENERNTLKQEQQCRF